MTLLLATLVSYLALIGIRHAPQPFSNRLADGIGLILLNEVVPRTDTDRFPVHLFRL